MPINVFGSTSGNTESKIVTSAFVQKPYLRTNYVESKNQEAIDMKHRFRIKNLPDPISIKEPASKNCVNNKVDNPRTTKKLRTC